MILFIMCQESCPDVLKVFSDSGISFYFYTFNIQQLARAFNNVNYSTLNNPLSYAFLHHPSNGTPEVTCFSYGTVIEALKIEGNFFFSEITTSYYTS